MTCCAGLAFSLLLFHAKGDGWTFVYFVFNHRMTDEGPPDAVWWAECAPYR
jgi:hypothetical protein